MQEIFMSTDEKRVAIMDNGNSINIVFIAGNEISNGFTTEMITIPSFAGANVTVR